MRPPHKGRLGASMTTIDNVSTAIRARIEHGSLGKRPHKVGHDHKRNVQRKQNIGSNIIEFRHVLIDYSNGNSQLKAKMMTRYDAFLRNEVLKGTGFAWALCSK